MNPFVVVKDEYGREIVISRHENTKVGAPEAPVGFMAKNLTLRQALTSWSRGVNAVKRPFWGIAAEVYASVMEELESGEVQRFLEAVYLIDRFATALESVVNGPVPIARPIPAVNRDDEVVGIVWETSVKLVLIYDREFQFAVVLYGNHALRASAMRRALLSETIL